MDALIRDLIWVFVIGVVTYYLIDWYRKRKRIYLLYSSIAAGVILLVTFLDMALYLYMLLAQPLPVNYQFLFHNIKLTLGTIAFIAFVVFQVLDNRSKYPSA